MTRTSIPRPRRMAAAGMLVLFAWSAVMPVLYRMDCITSGRSVSSWFSPISCPAVDVDGAGKHLAPACCIFYKADAVDGPNETIVRTADQPLHTSVVHMPLMAVRPQGDAYAVRALNDHGPPLGLGQRLARLSFLRV